MGRRFLREGRSTVNCSRCGSDKLTEQHVDVCYCSATPPSKVTGVPARVCDVCSEPHFAFEVAQQLEALDLSGEGHEIELLHVFRYGEPSRTEAMYAYLAAHSEPLTTEDAAVSTDVPGTGAQPIPVPDGLSV